MSDDIMTADEARKLLRPFLSVEATSGGAVRDHCRLCRAVTHYASRADAAEAERDALRAQLVALANEARPLVEATEGHTPMMRHLTMPSIATTLDHAWGLGRDCYQLVGRTANDHDRVTRNAESIREHHTGPAESAIRGLREIAARLVALAGGGEDG